MTIFVMPDGHILAEGSYTDTGEAWAFSNVVIPKHVVPDGQLLDVALPDDFVLGKYIYTNGAFTVDPNYKPPVKTNTVTGAK